MARGLRLDKIQAGFGAHSNRNVAVARRRALPPRRPGAEHPLRCRWLPVPVGACVEITLRSPREERRNIGSRVRLFGALASNRLRLRMAGESARAPSERRTGRARGSGRGDHAASRPRLILPIRVACHRAAVPAGDASLRSGARRRRTLTVTRASAGKPDRRIPSAEAQYLHNRTGKHVALSTAQTNDSAESFNIPAASALASRMWHGRTAAAFRLLVA
jgi:hypothetical protein